MVRLSTKKGFLLIAAIAMVVIAGLYGVVFTHILTSGSDANINYIQSMQSYYIADAGLNRGIFAVNAAHVMDNPDSISDVQARLGCATLINTSFGSGQFNISTATQQTTRVQLASSLSDSSTSVLLSSTSGLSSQGRVYVGQEAIDYSSLGTCAPSSTPCLLNVTRGSNGTAASSHDINTWVSQFACQLTAVGSVPSISSANGSTTLSAQVNMSAVYAAGVDNGRTMTFTHWNSLSNNIFRQASADQSTARNNNDIYGITAAGPNYLLAVGRKNQDNLFTLWQWDVSNSKWIQLTQPSVAQTNYRQNLNGISAASEKEAWAVGNRGGSGSNRRWTILRWNGSSWCAMTPGGACGGKTIPSDGRGSQIKNLRAVSVIDSNNDGLANFGFAVGDNGKILQYDGSSWTVISSPTTTRIRGVFVVSQNEAWACGDSGKVYRWNGSSWSQVNDFGGQQLYSITAIDSNGDGYANEGWVVGRQSSNGRAYHFTQSSPGSVSWTTNNPTGTANNRLYGVTMRRSNDVWAVGNGGRTIHWDGSSWTRVDSDVNKNLRAVTMVGPRTLKPQLFSETFN